MPLSSVLGAQSLVKPGVCTSSTRPASPFEGQTIYETDTDRLATWDGSAWIPYVRQTAGKVLQVVSTTKSNTFSTTANQTFTDITDLSVTITPSSTSSKIFVSAVLWATHDVSVNNCVARVVRGSTPIFVGDAAGNRAGGVSIFAPANYTMACAVFAHLDSPNTTSSTTYKVQMSNDNNLGTAYVNRSKLDTDGWVYSRAASSITVMEISG